MVSSSKHVEPSVFRLPLPRVQCLGIHMIHVKVLVCTHSVHCAMCYHYGIFACLQLHIFTSAYKQAVQ